MFFLDFILDFISIQVLFQDASMAQQNVHEFAKNYFKCIVESKFSTLVE